MSERKLDDKAVAAIERVLAQDDRVEIIPTKDGYKIVRVERITVKT